MWKSSKATVSNGLISTESLIGLTSKDIKNVMTIVRKVCFTYCGQLYIPKMAHNYGILGEQASQTSREYRDSIVYSRRARNFWHYDEFRT
jgi:hypothetical protein